MFTSEEAREVLSKFYRAMCAKYGAPTSRGLGYFNTVKTNWPENFNDLMKRVTNSRSLYSTSIIEEGKAAPWGLKEGRLRDFQAADIILATSIIRDPGIASVLSTDGITDESKIKIIDDFNSIVTQLQEKNHEQLAPLQDDGITPDRIAPVPNTDPFLQLTKGVNYPPVLIELFNKASASLAILKDTTRPNTTKFFELYDLIRFLYYSEVLGYPNAEANHVIGTSFVFTLLDEEENFNPEPTNDQWEAFWNKMDVLKSIQLAHEKRTESLKTERVNLNEYPTNILPSEQQWINVGDMHGNSLKMLYTIIKTGVVTLPREDYQEFIRLYNNLPPFSRHTSFQDFWKSAEGNDRITQMKEIINKLQLGSNRQTGLRFLGDIFADRGKNDYLSLLIFQKLDEHKVPIDITVSNHDVGLIGYKDKNILPRITPCDSIQALMIMKDSNQISQEEFDNLYDIYKKSLKFMSYEEKPDGQLIVYSHARPSNPFLFNLIAEYVDLQEPYLQLNGKFDKEALKAVINKINAEFAERLGTNTVNAEDISIGTFGEILDLVTWGERGRAWKELNDKGPANIDYTVVFTHGHEGAGQKEDARFINLDTDLGKAASLDEEMLAYTITQSAGPTPNPIASNESNIIAEYRKYLRDLSIKLRKIEQPVDIIAQIQTLITSCDTEESIDAFRRNIIAINALVETIQMSPLPSATMLGVPEHAEPPKSEVERNKDEIQTDSPACSGGTFNKIIEKLVGIHPDAELLVITPQQATAKLQVVVKEEAYKHLYSLASPDTKEDLKIFTDLIEKIKKDGIEVIWDKITDNIATRMIDEFGSIYNNSKDNADFQRLLADGKHVDLDELDKFQKQIFESKGYNEFMKSVIRHNAVPAQQSPEKLDGSPGGHKPGSQK